MPKGSYDRLGRLQRAVMEIVWDLGEGSVHQVIERLPGAKRPAYTTILTVMQKLEKNGWLIHRQEGRTYVYSPTQSRQELGARSIGQAIRQLFGGNLRAFMQRLLDDEKLTDDDLAEMRHMIDRRRRK